MSYIAPVMSRTQITSTAYASAGTRRFRIGEKTTVERPRFSGRPGKPGRSRTVRAEQPEAKHRYASWAVLAVCSLLFLSVAGCRNDEQVRIRETAESVEALTDARTRVVWVADHGDQRDVFARSSERQLKLMGYDSRDGMGVRPIIDTLSNYSKPLFTPDGRRVVFSDFHEMIVSVVDFDGENRRELAPGMGLAVWRDPESGVDWVYVGRERVDRRGHPYAEVYRFPLDSPEEEELVWNRRPVGLDNFQLSADGTRAAGVYPWPDAGVADLVNGSWTRLGNGCWPSLAPDNSYLFWFFEGNHRDLEMFDTRTDRRWTTRINTSPAMDGHPVYHPRWSNHPRFIALTGPYTRRQGHSFIRGGGPDVEIHVGRFNESFTEIEEWVQVTDNEQANFIPDVWVESAALTPAEAATPVADAEALVPDETTWPPGQEDLLFVWEDRSRNNEIEDPAGDRVIVCRVEPEGRARYGRFHEMDVRRGRFVAEEMEDLLKNRYREKTAFTFEALLTPSDAHGDSPGLVAGMSAAAERRNFALLEENGVLYFQARLSVEGQDADIHRWALFPLNGNETVHVVVTYEPGRIRAYRNGEPMFTRETQDADFRGWQALPLVFGGDADGSESWPGHIEGVALYNRALAPDEVPVHHAVYARRLADRVPAEQVKVQARLINVTPVPEPESIEPYRRALVVNEYEIEDVESGSIDFENVLVAHWAIMDDHVLDTAERAPGKTYRMTLEPYDERPELEGEWMAMEADDLLMPLYYDVDS